MPGCSHNLDHPKGHGCRRRCEPSPLTTAASLARAPFDAPGLTTDEFVAVAVSPVSCEALASAAASAAF